MPMRASWTPSSRNAPTASACACRSTCPACTAVPKSLRPGACTPWACPAKEDTHGSFSVIQIFTRSPRCVYMQVAYSANHDAVSRLVHPPASCSACGRSQW